MFDASMREVETMAVDWVTIETAASETGLCTKTIRNAIKRGQIQARKLSPRVLLISLRSARAYEPGRRYTKRGEWAGHAK